MININDLTITSLQFQANLYSMRMDYDTSGNITYIGFAKPGSTEDKPVWAIKKLEYDDNGNLVAIKWAEGNNNFDKIWNNRTTYSYS